MNDAQANTDDTVSRHQLTNEPPPTSSQATGNVPLAAVIDAVNGIPNEAARRMIIAQLRIHATRMGTGDQLPLAWLTRRGGYLAIVG